MSFNFEQKTDKPLQQINAKDAYACFRVYLMVIIRAQKLLNPLLKAS